MSDRASSFRFEIIARRVDTDYTEGDCLKFNLCTVLYKIQIEKNQNIRLPPLSQPEDLNVPVRNKVTDPQKVCLFGAKRQTVRSGETK